MLRGHLLRSANVTAFVLTILVVYQNHHFTGSDIQDGVSD